MQLAVQPPCNTGHWSITFADTTVLLWLVWSCSDSSQEAVMLSASFNNPHTQAPHGHHLGCIAAHAFNEMQTAVAGATV